MNPLLRHPILVAEDEENDVFLLRRALQKGGSEQPLYWVPDGEEAIAYLRGDGKYADRQQYPFPMTLITDLKMPRKSGFELLQWIKEHPSCSVIPAIVLTSSSEPSDISEAYRLGANAYMVKPLAAEEWQEMMKCAVEFWCHWCHKPIPPEKC